MKKSVNSFYFYIAFYSDGTMRMFNTKRIPRPTNSSCEGKLIYVKKFYHRINLQYKRTYERE